MDAELHLEEARRIAERLDALTEVDQIFEPSRTLRPLRAHCRACIVMGVAGVEAFANWVIDRRMQRQPADIPEKWLPEYLKPGKYKQWPLRQKLWLLPSLCLAKPRSPEEFWKRQGGRFNRFAEYIRIRNSIAHGHTAETKLRVKGHRHGVRIVDDSEFVDNFWPLSRLPRDMFSLKYEDAERAHKSMVWMMQRLVTALEDRIGRKDLVEQDMVYQGQERTVLRESVVEEIPQWVEKAMGRTARRSERKSPRRDQR
jgi:hypothetical protein